MLLVYNQHCKVNREFIGRINKEKIDIEIKDMDEVQRNISAYPCLIYDEENSLVITEDSLEDVIELFQNNIFDRDGIVEKIDKDNFRQYNKLKIDVFEEPQYEIHLFNNINEMYEFHIEYNTKALTNLCDYEWISAEKLNEHTIDSEQELINMKSNDYLRENTIEDLANDIQQNGMYWPFLGYWENDKFVVTEGTHRVKAVKKIGGKYLCLFLKDGSNYINNDENIEDLNLFLYVYEGKLMLRKKRVKYIMEALSEYVSINQKISDSIFRKDFNEHINPYYMISKKIDFNRLLSEDFIRDNIEYYSQDKETVQDLYDKYLDNLAKYESCSKWININDIHIEYNQNKNFEDLCEADPFLNAYDMEHLSGDILNNGMYWPFIVYYKDEKYYIAEGYHRYQALKESGVNIDIYCIVLDKDIIYEKIPCYDNNYEEEMYIVEDLFPHDTYPYIPHNPGFIIIEELDNCFKIKINNDIQKIQAYKTFPMTLKHMINFLNIRYGEDITRGQFVREVK